MFNRTAAVRKVLQVPLPVLLLLVPQPKRLSFSVSFMFTYADLRDSIVSVWVWCEDFVLLFSLELEAVQVRLFLSCLGNRFV